MWTSFGGRKEPKARKWGHWPFERTFFHTKDIPVTKAKIWLEVGLSRGIWASRAWWIQYSSLDYMFSLALCGAGADADDGSDTGNVNAILARNAVLERPGLILRDSESANQSDDGVGPERQQESSNQPNKTTQCRWFYRKTSMCSHFPSVSTVLLYQEDHGGPGCLSPWTHIWQDSFDDKNWESTTGVSTVPLGPSLKRKSNTKEKIALEERRQKAWMTELICLNRKQVKLPTINRSLEHFTVPFHSNSCRILSLKQRANLCDILKWIKTHGTSPITRQPLSSKQLYGNNALLNALIECIGEDGEEGDVHPSIRQWKEDCCKRQHQASELPIAWCQG